MNTIAFMVLGHHVGLSEIMLILLGLFVLVLVARNIILYWSKPQAK